MGAGPRSIPSPRSREKASRFRQPGIPNSLREKSISSRDLVTKDTGACAYNLETDGVIHLSFDPIFAGSMARPGYARVLRRFELWGSALYAGGHGDCERPVE